jgi:hypothetical protein
MQIQKGLFHASKQLLFKIKRGCFEIQKRLFSKSLSKSTFHYYSEKVGERGSS